jgi:hypothetical protein
VRTSKGAGIESGDGFVMSNSTSTSSAFIIEVQSRTAGIVVRDGCVFRFHAATFDFNELDGRDFLSPGEAHKAAIRHVAAQAVVRAGRLAGAALGLTARTR